MSDIVIRGIEMPKDKPLNLSSMEMPKTGSRIIEINFRGEVFELFKTDNERGGFLKSRKLEAVELPEHGNLKEEKAIEKTIVEYMGLDSIADLMPAERSIYNCIGYAPTILEASK